MNDSIDDKRRFATLMTALSDYYRQEISKGVMALYWEGLKAYDFEAVERAMWAHTQTPDEVGRWMPKISDLAKVMQGRTSDQAQIAWAKVDRAARVVGAYADVVFDDALIHRVLADMGGWAMLGSKTESDWPFVAKEFENRYRGYKMRTEAPEYPPCLIGLASTYNSTEGFKSQGMRLIGNVDKAKQVYKGGNNNSQIGMQTASDALRIES